MYINLSIDPFRISEGILIELQLYVTSRLAAF